MSSLLYTLTNSSGQFLKKLNNNIYIFQDLKSEMFSTEKRFLLEDIRSNLSYYLDDNSKIKLTSDEVFLNIIDETDNSLTVTTTYYSSKDNYNTTFYFSDFETKSIGGGNPYSCCAECGISVPQINMALNGHSDDCEYREYKEKELLEEERLKYLLKDKPKLKIFETNSALGYNELAILIKIKDGLYLVVDTKNISIYNEYYVIGKTVELEDYEVEETSYDISKSPLSGTFLFDFYLLKR